MEKSEVKEIVREVLHSEILPQFMELIRTSEDRLTGYRNELQSAKTRCEHYESKIADLEKRNSRLQEKYDRLHESNEKLMEKYETLAERSLDKSTGSRADVKLNL